MEYFFLSLGLVILSLVIYLVYDISKNPKTRTISFTEKCHQHYRQIEKNERKNNGRKTQRHT